MNKGFTFIEILITLGLMVLLMAFGFAAFDRFNGKQRVSEASFSVQNMLRSAQVKARAGDKPVGCTKLLNYRVNLTANSGNVVVSAICTTPAAVISRETYSMPAGVVAESTQTLDFLVLSGGATLSPNQMIILKSTDNTWRYGFTLDAGGAVSEGAFL